MATYKDLSHYFNVFKKHLLSKTDNELWIYSTHTYICIYIQVKCKTK